MRALLTSCPYDSLTLDQLSNDQLLVKRTNNQKIGGFMLLLLVLTVGLAFIFESYLVGVASWALLPALDEYSKKRKALSKQLQKRNMA